uniref:Uncharacterized protein n=1 Tax=Opuntia streptacantha TaxID=393608 RepID=A0A7C9ARU5_OPUST
MKFKKYNILCFSYNIKNMDYYKASKVKKLLEIFVSLNILWHDLHIFDVRRLLSKDQISISCKLIPIFNVFSFINCVQCYFQIIEGKKGYRSLVCKKMQL